MHELNAVVLSIAFKAVRLDREVFEVVAVADLDFRVLIDIPCCDLCLSICTFARPYACTSAAHALSHPMLYLCLNRGVSTTLFFILFRSIGTAEN